MRIHFSQHWQRYEGIFVFSILAIHWGYERFGVTIFNFAIELEK